MAESGYRHEVAVVGMFISRAAVVGVSSPCQFLGTDSLALCPRAGDTELVSLSSVGGGGHPEALRGR